MNASRGPAPNGELISQELGLCSAEFKWAECPNIQPILVLVLARASSGKNRQAGKLAAGFHLRAAFVAEFRAWTKLGLAL
jgi:hypothetical protein